MSPQNIRDAQKHATQTIKFIEGDITKMAATDFLAANNTHLTIAFFIGILAQQVLSNPQDALAVLQKTCRNAPDLVVISSKTPPLFNVEMLKAVGFRVALSKMPSLDSTTDNTSSYFLEPMSEDERYAKLVKRAKQRHADGTFLDFSMSANPVADFELLLKKAYALDKVQYIDLSWAMMPGNGATVLLQTLRKHAPNLKEIFIANTEVWSSNLTRLLEFTKQYSLLRRQEQQSGLSYYKAKLLNFPLLPATTLYSPQTNHDNASSSSTPAVAKK